MAITDTYLSKPDLLPVPGENSRCGDNQLYIDFVGGPYHVQGLNDKQAKQLARHFKGACINAPSESAEVIQIIVYQASPECFQLPVPPPVYREFELDALETEVRIAGENMYALIDLSGTVSGHLWTIAHDDFFHSNTFENFFRMLVTYCLMKGGGMLLHSAGVINNSEAYLFPGRSEDGKSTLSKLSIEEGRTVLSDDMNAITWHKGQPFVEKVPFTGDLERSWTRSSSYPLKAIFAIRKAPVTAIGKLSRARTMTLLTSCTPYINSDAHRMSQLLENHYHLTQKVPSHILDFSLSGEIWKVIEASLASE